MAGRGVATSVAPNGEHYSAALLQINLKEALL
jgi:hypothetical protein